MLVKAIPWIIGCAVLVSTAGCARESWTLITEKTVVAPIGVPANTLTSGVVPFAKEKRIYLDVILTAAIRENVHGEKVFRVDMKRGSRVLSTRNHVAAEPAEQRNRTEPVCDANISAVYQGRSEVVNAKTDAKGNARLDISSFVQWAYEDTSNNGLTIEVSASKAGVAENDKVSFDRDKLAPLYKALW
jgi:hypothetical protein